jgi:hypothetical protein
MRTVWLTQEQVDMLNTYVSENNDALSESIRKELTIAKVRSSNNRVLKSAFISILGKKDSAPYRFKEEEIELIDNLFKKQEK